MTRPRAIVYIDGYNLYFARIKNSAYRWLDLTLFADHLLPDHDVVQVKYFTARVGSLQWDPGQAERQSVYLRALGTFPRIEIVPGKFQRRPKWLPQSDDLAHHHVRVSCEKRSDLNLAVHLVCDAFTGRFDEALVVSSDSDLALAVRMATDLSGRPVGVANTHRQRGKEISAAAAFLVEIREHVLADSQLPMVVMSGGRQLRRPMAWDPPATPLPETQA